MNYIFTPTGSLWEEDFGTVSEEEEMSHFLEKYGKGIPSGLTTVPYFSRAYWSSRKSKADNGLTSVSFCLESKVLRARIGVHRELPIVPSENRPDTTSSWACTLTLQEGPDQSGKIHYSKGHRNRSPQGEEGST